MQSIGLNWIVLWKVQIEGEQSRDGGEGEDRRREVG